MALTKVQKLGEHHLNLLLLVRAPSQGMYSQNHQNDVISHLIPIHGEAKKIKLN